TPISSTRTGSVARASRTPSSRSGWGHVARVATGTPSGSSARSPRFEASGPLLSISGGPERLSSVHSMFPHDPEESMKYLCVIYSEEAEFPKMPKAEADKWMSAYMEFTDRITKRGQ